MALAKLGRDSENDTQLLSLSPVKGDPSLEGAGDDQPVAGDYDGDGKTDLAVYRPSEGNWYIIQSFSNYVTVRSWGASDDRPVPGDYDADGKTDIAVFRPSENTWYIIRSSTGTATSCFLGSSNDVPVPWAYVSQ